MKHYALHAGYLYGYHASHVKFKITTLCLFPLVSCTELIKQSLVDDSKLGEAVRPYVERKMLGKKITPSFCSIDLSTHKVRVKAVK